MRMNVQFDHLLSNTVNLKEGRLRKLEDRVVTVFGVLDTSAAVGELVRGWDPQGSWAHRTIITPPRDAEYDADFLLVLSHNPDWDDEPVRYRDAIWQSLDDNGTYKAMPHTRKCRCVRLTYSDDCHLDIVPYVQLTDRAVIVNGDANGGAGEWEDTNPQGFTVWFDERDLITNGNLRLVIRLLKYLRDYKATFRGTRSVILNTIVGNLISWDRAAQEPGCYEDVPRTLVTITSDLDAWLQENEAMPSIEDPSGTGLTFDHRWGPESYNALRDRMHDYAADIADAYAETDEAASLEKWQGLFGPGFTLPPEETSTPRFGPVVPPKRTSPSRAG